MDNGEKAMLFLLGLIFSTIVALGLAHYCYINKMVENGYVQEAKPSSYTIIWVKK